MRTKTTILAGFTILCGLFATQQLKAQIWAGNDTMVCAGQPVTLTATVNCGLATTGYTESTIAYNPDPFNVGTATTLTDDNWTSIINLPFSFCFYGNTYTQCLIGSNNIITFDLTGAGGYCQWPISTANPSASNPMNSIMGPWQDLLPTAGGTIKYATYGAAPYRRFCAVYDAVSFFSCTGSHYSGEMILYESTNAIEMHVMTKPVCSGWNAGAAIEGLQDGPPAPTGATITVGGRNYPTQFTLNNDAVRFCGNGAVAYSVNWYVSGNPTVIGTGLTLNVSPLVTTTYVAEVIYACNNGTSTDTVVVNMGGMPMSLDSVPTACTGSTGVAFLTSVGGAGPFTYSWSPSGGNTPTASNLAAGLYTLTVTDAGSGCVSSDTISVTSSSGLSAVQGQTDVLCHGGTTGVAFVTPTGTAPFGYTWVGTVNATGTASNLAAGNYTCTTSDANACTVSNTFIITEPPSLTVATVPSPSLCFGGATGSATSAGAGGVGPYTYLWSPSGGAVQNAVNLAPGTYTVTVTDANLCTATQTAVITSPPALSVTTSPPVSICIGQNTQLTATGAGGTPAYTYTWSDGQAGSPVTMAPAVTTTYSVTVTDANACTSVSPTVVVTVNPPLNVVASNPVTICIGQSATISATGNGGDGNYTYSWNSGGNGAGPIVVTPGATFTYVVTLTDGCGSPAVQSNVTVTVDPLPTVLFSGSPLSGCSPLGVQFLDASVIAGGNISAWNWNFGDGNTSNLAAPVDSFYAVGSYDVSLTVTSNLGCVQTATVSAMVTVNPNPVAGFLMTPQTTTLFDPKVTFSDRSIGADSLIFYDFGDNTGSNLPSPVHQFGATGTYPVKQFVVNQFGCVDSLYEFVIITNDFTIYIPNAFTPDHDGHNDVFTASGSGITDYSMDIFDRWGEAIFHTTDINLPWDGTVSGEKAKPDVYVYSISVKDIFAVGHKYVGKVALLR